MNPEEVLALLLDIARKGVVIEQQARYIAQLEARIKDLEKGGVDVVS